jgi:hypothetical protein
MSAVWEVAGKVQGRVISIVEDDEPVRVVTAMVSKPHEDFVGVAIYGLCNVF